MPLAWAYSAGLVTRLVEMAQVNPALVEAAIKAHDPTTLASLGVLALAGTNVGLRLIRPAKEAIKAVVPKLDTAIATVVKPIMAEAGHLWRSTLDLACKTTNYEGNVKKNHHKFLFIGEQKEKARAEAERKKKNVI